MTTEYLRTFVLPAAYELLPAEMESPAATAMLLAIGWQESRFAHRTQIGGPARGFWQFEQRGGVAGVLSHHASREPAGEALRQLSYPEDATPFVIYDALAHNDVLAAAFARLLLWTVPQGLPSAGQSSRGWSQYMAAWRPGRPHRATWASAWSHGWPDTVEV